MNLFLKRTHISSHIIIVLLLIIGGCNDRVDLPDNSTPIDEVDKFISSFDSSLVSVKDEFESIFMENVSFSMTSLQYDSLKELSFKIYPKNKNSIVDTFTVSYSKEYISSNFFYDLIEKKITLPIFGLYDAHMNTVLISSKFNNGKKWEKTINIETELFSYSDNNNVSVFNPSSKIDFTYMYINTDPGPMIMDIEGNVRWAADEFLDKTKPKSLYLDNHFYCVSRSTPINELIKLGFNGSQDTVSVDIGDYPGAGFHHDMAFGPNGFLIELNIRDGSEFIKRGSVLIETDVKGKLLQTWDMDEIIGRYLIESNVPVETFIRNATNNDKALDWFHMNNALYDERDNSVLMSSRENFVIKVGYDDKEIKWILGDTTKFWYTIDTLRHYAIHLEDGNINIGQHSLSILENGELLMYNNGDNSTVPFFPKDKLGLLHSNSMISSYKIVEQEKRAKESFHLELPFFAPNRGSVQKNGSTFLTTSLPEEAGYNSLINIYDDKQNLLLEIKNYSYFCNSAEKFSHILEF